MKKAFKLFCAAAAIVALAASCQPEKEFGATVSTENGTVILTAGFVSETRTDIAADNSITWSKGDMIYINDGTNETYASVPDSCAGKAIATFEATGISASADEFYGVYTGIASIETVSAGKFKFDIDKQDGTFNGAHLAFAKADSKKNLKFGNLTSIISFETASTDIEYVEFSGLIEDDEFPTAATFDFADSTVVVVDASATRRVYLNGKAGKYYLGFFPVKGISGLKLTVCHKNETVKEISIEKAFDFTANYILDLGNIDAREGKSYKTAAKSSFDTINGTIGTGFTYKSFKGDAGTAPALYNNAIRLYQTGSGKKSGGYIEISSVQGDKINGIHMGLSNNSTIAYTVDGSALNVADSIQVNKYDGVNLNNLNASKVVVYCVHLNSSYRLNIKDLTITYTADSRTVQDLAFAEASYFGVIGQAFAAPVLNGAQTTVAYSSSDSNVATVDPATGAVTLVAPGYCTISAVAEESATYKQGNASYSLTVATPATGVKGIKTAINNSAKTIPFSATLTDAVITYVAKDYPYTCYIEDAEAAVTIYNVAKINDYVKKGDKINGVVTGAGTLYNATLEITSVDFSKAAITHDATLPETTVTIANLVANYANYEYRRIKVANANVADGMGSNDRDGKIAQSTDTINLYGQIANAISIDKGVNVDLIGFPVYYWNKADSSTVKQIGVWEQSDITVLGGAGVITLGTTTKTMDINDTFTLTATCNSGATVTFVSQNPSVATVDANGLVTAVAAGTTKIIASAAAKDSYTAAEAECAITVNEAGAKSWKIMTSASSALKAGDQVIIAAFADTCAYAMATQNANNRRVGGVTKASGVITAYADTVTIFTIVAGIEDNSFGFKDNKSNQYLYNATSGSNYLRSQANVDKNASFNVTFDAKGIATVKIISTASISKNWLRFNYSSKIFSCYGSGQLDVAIYRYE